MLRTRGIWSGKNRTARWTMVNGFAGLNGSNGSWALRRPPPLLIRETLILVIARIRRIGRTYAHRRTSGEVVLRFTRDVGQSLAVVATDAQRLPTGRLTAVAHPLVGARRKGGITQRRNCIFAAPGRHLPADRRHLRQRRYISCIHSTK